MLRARAILGHYARLLRDAPGHLWKAADVLGRVAFLILVLLFVLLGYRGGIPIEWMAAAIAAFLIAALAVAEFDRYDEVRAERDEWHDQYRHIWADDINKTMSRAADAALGDQLDKGVSLLGGVLSDEWRAHVSQIDTWAKETERLLKGLGSTEDVSEYTVGLPWLPADVTQNALRLFLEIRLARLHAIYQRPRKQAVSPLTIEPDFHPHERPNAR